MAAEIRVDTITSRSGINTLSFTGDGFSFLTSVGIGTTITTNPVGASNTSKLAVGIVTANYYYGDGSRLTNIISGVGIQSGGTLVGTGFTTINFIGAGNTFSTNGTTINVSISGGGTEIKTLGITTTAAVGVGSFATGTHRSAVVTAQIAQGTNYQVGRYLMIHNGSTVTVVEQAAVSTGSTMLGSFTGAISGSNAELRVSMVTSGIATVTTKIDTVTV